jgi:hypothetical protein
VDPADPKAAVVAVVVAVQPPAVPGASVARVNASFISLAKPSYLTQDK